VEKLRRQVKFGNAEPHVYWGKIARGCDSARLESLRTTWLGLRERLRARREDHPAQETLAFVTDLSGLHALLLEDFVEDTRLRTKDTEQVPSYYGELPEDVDVRFWLKVRDIQNIFHDPSRTIRYLRECLDFDPYSSQAKNYPLVLNWAPPLEEKGPLFSAEKLKERTARRDVRLFAELDDTVFPRDLREAHGRVEEAVGRDIWKKLQNDSQVTAFVASAYLAGKQLGSIENPETMDWGGPTTQYARAIERLFVHGILERARSAHDGKLGELGRVLRSAFQQWKVRRCTLGVGDRIMGMWSEETDFADLPRLGALCRDGKWRGWYSQFVEVRKDASHQGVIVPLGKFKVVEDGILGGSGASVLCPLVEAWEEVRLHRARQ
jgi:hypothetical protein